MSRRSLWRIGVWLAMGLCAASKPAQGAVAQNLGNASIAQDARTGNWSISAGGATLTLSLDSARDFQIVGLVGPTGRPWVPQAQSDTTVTVNGVTAAFGRRDGDFQYENTATSNDGYRLQLDASFVLRAADLRVTRHIAVTDGSPTFEVWTTFQALGPRMSTVEDINAIQLTLAAGTLHWVTGLQGNGNDDGARDSAFLRQQRDLGSGETLSLGGDGRSSERAVPWLAIDGTGEEFYAGLMWSGGWSLTATGMNTGVALSWGLAPMSTSVGTAPVDGPHLLFGIARGTLSAATAAMNTYVLNGVRSGRPFTPLVTYNTWFAYGTRVDAVTMQREMAKAAALGAELFVLDAGWYAGADTKDITNFDEGLGTWQPDPDRFPDGLGALADYAHSLGMKFGIWVEPERVNLSVVGRDGFDESWLATSGGSYTSDRTAQVCLAGAAGRQWVIDRLSALIDAAQPDYLKWDNNLWVNCDRDGHDHGAADGNFAHVTALYQILDGLRQRYPDLLIENCSGGGNRIDFGMLRYTDTAWMDDHTAPSAHVRHNLEGLNSAFPPSYLLSFVTDEEPEPLHDARDLSLYFRSRMGGILGLCFLGETMSDPDAFGIAREIAIYKSVRDMMGASSTSSLISQQASMADAPAWDVMQTSTASGDAYILYAYQNDQGTTSVRVMPVDLQPDATYAVTSVDAGLLGEALGSDLMASGIDVVQSPLSAAHLLTIVKTSDPAGGDPTSGDPAAAGARSRPSR